jgi:CRP-like cAMP-binding protein
MGQRKDRRRDPRTALGRPEVGLFLSGSAGAGADLVEAFYADVLNRGRSGALLKTRKEFRVPTSFFLNVYDARAGTWVGFSAVVRWTAREPGEEDFFLVGAAFRKPGRAEKIPNLDDLHVKELPLPSDYEFFRRTKPLKYICREAVCPLLNSVIPKRVRAGERFITQGEKGDTLFIIQSGSCMVTLEKEGKIIPISRCSEGDIVGEMALLTGEPRSAHVEAETDMILWGLTQGQFERISRELPDFRVFLTDIVSERFSSRREIAKREIGKYIVTDIIGRGSYSVVYKGKHAVLNMPVCVKMLKHDLAMDPGFQRAFKEEARLIAALSHPNIVRVYDIEERYRTLFIIMEYLQGVSLRYHLDHGPALSYRRILSILIQACASLDYAHKKGVVHRDIKPANLFLLPTDQIKVVDFGVAVLAGAQDGNIVGTVHYMAPEQITCDPADGRIDIYALGISAYEMVTGQRPYPEDDPHRVLTMHLRRDIPDPAERRPDIPEELRAFILTACRRAPEDRYRDFGQALRQLHSLAARVGLNRSDLSPEKRKLMTIHLTYGDADQAAVRQVLEEFGSRAGEKGIAVKVAAFDDP